jgi:spore maturation protein CgeB
MLITILGLSITSSWGNGHATTYRSLISGLEQLGHHVVFLERDTSWYSSHRDMPSPPHCEARLYTSVEELCDLFSHEIRDADLAIVGSFVPDGIEVAKIVQANAKGITAFYDIDTPVTLSRLATGTCDYLSRKSISGFDIYLSFSGGPMLKRLEGEFGALMARALYCSVDPAVYHPEAMQSVYDLGYLGTYSDDRQPTLNRLLMEPARQLSGATFMVAGPQYPEHISWPANVSRIDHLPPDQHATFYNSQRFTLNVTRRDMISAGYSPSVRIFEAAACGVPVISDVWDGLEELLTPQKEILFASSSSEVVEYLTKLSEAKRAEIGRAGRERILAQHTNVHRAQQLCRYVDEAAARKVQTLAVQEPMY